MSYNLVLWHRNIIFARIYQYGEIMKSLKRYIFFYLSMLAVIVVTSCIPQRKVILFQDKEMLGDTISKTIDVITDRYILQPNDQLYISVQSPDPELSRFFNLNNQSGANMSGTNMSLLYYELNDSVQVDFPVIGQVNLKGCSLSVAKERISEAVSHYLSDYTLNVKLVSNTFVALGEFNRPGLLTMARPQVTLYDAVAMAGGFGTYAKSGEVNIMRKDANGRQVIYTVDMTGRDVINSDLYYVYPNDVIYVKPLKIKVLGFGETLSFGLLTSFLTLVLLVLNFVK